jgi:diphosphomevalonate decarboxylase
VTVTASASPSLALVKYWGKMSGGVNLPATPSLAVTLDDLRTTTTITGADATDEVFIGGQAQPSASFLPVIETFRRRSGSQTAVRVESVNTFPTAAGIASSSSGFAALTIGMDAFYGTGLSPAELSAIARLGSGSAARAVFGGFTVWPAGAESARCLLPADHWPDLRILIVLVHSGKKPVSSRAGMLQTAETSPIYDAWCKESTAIYERAVEALEGRDIAALGTAMRESYLFMFSTMFTTRPPVIYWLPLSLAVIRAAESMRSAGIPVWETMDAGPQVKLVTTESYVDEVKASLAESAPGATVIVTAPGGEPEVVRG